MRKVLVEIFIPAANRQFDVFLPEHLPLYEVTRMVGKAASEISNGMFRSDEDTVICNRMDGAVLNNNLSVYELKIKNGTQLMLI